MSKKEYYHVTDGEWVEVPFKNHYDQCCDCGLVHVLNFRIKIKGGKRILLVQATRHGRATSGARSQFRFKDK